MGLNHEAAPETVALRRLLKTLQPGESLMYPQMKNTLGFDPLEHKGKLYSVRDSLKRCGEMVIEIVPNLGVRRLSDKEVVNEHASLYLKKIRRASARGQGANSSVAYNALTPEDQTRHNTTQAAFGAMRLLGGRKAQVTIADGVERARVTLPPRDVLKLFE